MIPTAPPPGPTLAPWLARRALLRCAPLKLPPDLYEGGWQDIEFVFNPKVMG